MPWNALNSVTFLELLIDTENAGITANDTITIPLVGTANIFWGDGTSDIGASGTTTHTYSVAGQYVVKIADTADQIRYNDGNDDTKLLEIQKWGKMKWTTMFTSFKGCSAMTITATDLPDLALVTDFNNAFRNCSSMVTFPLMDTSNVTVMK